ncbi:MAG: hypothetical protein R3D98_15590 [Candidatus Krumholzibacteriia bacterium]
MTTRKQTIIVTLAALLVLIAAGSLAQVAEPILPEVRIESPSTIYDQQESVTLSPSPVFRLGNGYDQPGVEIGHVRWLLKPARLSGGQYIFTRTGFEQNVDALLPFDDPAWTAWLAWGDAEEATIEVPALATLDDQGNRIYYLFAAQVMGDDGVVSTLRTYNRNVANFSVSENLAPYLVVSHPLLGQIETSGPAGTRAYDLLPGLPEGFTFAASAEEYGSDVASYRWGWDLVDPDDPDDPGWSGPAGLGDLQRHTPPLPFSSGVHTLTVDVRDLAGGATRLAITLAMVPMPDLPDRLPLLLVDDVRDRSSNAWPDADGDPRDRDPYRDEFWLSVADGVTGFEPARDIIDTEADPLELRDLVNYRTVAWSGRYTSPPNSKISAEFRPLEESIGQWIALRYNWLAAYQEQGGNLLYSSDRAAMNFVPESPYVLPTVFESAEGNPYSGYGYVPHAGSVRLGFGTDEYGPIYPRLYPYRNLGLAAVDITSPAGPYYAPSGLGIRTIRKAPCVGLKGLVLDAQFIADHMAGAAAFPDTILTDPEIDWTDDPLAAEGDVLVHQFIWGEDEFYDVDVLNRGTPFAPQDCDGAPCVEPLWRMASRFDWIRHERQAADPDDTWPTGYYNGAGQLSLNDLCGLQALEPGQLATRTDQQVTAFVTRRFLDQKPSGAGDVVLGFDPYRFDHAAMRSALLWILGEHFGLATTQ